MCVSVIPNVSAAMSFKEYVEPVRLTWPVVMSTIRCNESKRNAGN